MDTDNRVGKAWGEGHVYYFKQRRFFFLFYLKRTLLTTGLQYVKHTGCCRLHRPWWIFWASPSRLHYIVYEELAFGPWMQPRKGNEGRCLGSEVTSNLWSLKPLSPPQVQYLCLQFYGDCGSGRLLLQMPPGHLFIHQNNPWSNCSFHHQQKRENVMKSIFGCIAGVRNIFGIGCCSCILDYNHKRRTGDWDYYAKNRGSREQSPLALIRQFLSNSVGWEPRAGWIHHTKHLQRQTPIFCGSLSMKSKL